MSFCCTCAKVLSAILLVFFYCSNSLFAGTGEANGTTKAIDGKKKTKKSQRCCFLQNMELWILSEPEKGAEWRAVPSTSLT